MGSSAEDEKQYMELAPEVRKKADYLFEVLRCPTCQNMPIKDSYSEVSETMKRIIIDKLKEGWSEKDIINYFVQRYGKDILLDPGYGFISYLPFLVLGSGALFIFIIILRMRKM